MPNAIQQIYDQLVQVLGGTNPDQIFCMTMPGTTLDAKDYAYDTSAMKPAIVQEAESKLTDQMFDITQVTASSNGERVSSQYLQALSVLVPDFNPMMPVLKKTLRDYLNTPMPDSTIVDGKPFVGSLQDYYFLLYDNYVNVKLDWEKQIVAKKTELAANPDTENELYLEWYEQIAEAELAKVDEALAKVLVVFSPSDMDAILGALAAGPGGEIEEAANSVNDIQLASPEGGFFYPVDLTPDDWFLDLASDLNPANLLQDPQFIGQTISAKRQALTASISQVQSMLNNMPTKGEIKTAADNLQVAQKAYTDAQNNLLDNYADNTATAIDMYLAATSGGALPDPDTGVNTLNKDAIKVSQAKNENPVATGATTKNGAPISAADVQKLVDGQKKLIAAQSTLQTSSQALADAGVNLASQEAAYFGDLPVILTRMQSQLSELNDLQNNLNISISSSGSNPIPPLNAVASPAVMAAATLALTNAKTAADADGATAATVVTAVGTDPQIPTVTTAATTAAEGSIGNVMLALSTITSTLTATKDITLAKAILGAAQTAIAKSNATATTVLTAITGANTGATAIAGLNDACTLAAKASAADVLKAVTVVVSALTLAPSAQKSDGSQRFMELQLSFSKSDMESNSSTDTSFTQTSWSVDLFFGSASGNSSSSSAVTAKNSFEKDTEIKVGLKAAKVDIRRGWLDPGVFKLSSDMSRISNVPVSGGPMPVATDSDGNIYTDWTQFKAIKEMNAAIFPCFPVSFLVVKDVNITFQATESSLSAVQSVLDSKSATGGGFLCFSASSSSASHSDSSSIATRSQGTLINIAMPGPQILGWYLEMTPQDNSTILTSAPPTSSTDDINIIQFINQLTAISKDAKLAMAVGKVVDSISSN
jgi:hypothetical protein